MNSIILQNIIDEVHAKVVNSNRVVFVYGNFNIIHPGHLRLLNFARECGDFLLVAVAADDRPGVFVPQELRLEGVLAITSVSHAVLLPVLPEVFIAAIKPHIVVKGKEHEAMFNPELSVLDSYGGELIFSSGDIRFSSLDLLQRELIDSDRKVIKKPKEFYKRHDLNSASLSNILSKFSSKRVIVIGDLIVDEYITCDPLGMSQEDPTIVVTPVKRDMFIGGAGIVAAHAAGLGAKVDYFGVTGGDQTSAFASKTLNDYGVSGHLFEDESRPTTLKQRYRARGKTLLRVSHLRQHEIGHGLAQKILEQIESILTETDLVVFSDFNYGCLPQFLVKELVTKCKTLGIPMIADSQSSSQLGDVSRFEGMLLITPTEHEARLSVRDYGSGLAILANALLKKTSAKNVFITLGAEGMLMLGSVFTGQELITDQLPALNSSPKDVSGAGDSLLITAGLALIAGGNVWESAYLGSIAAACQVGRVGNSPLSRDEIYKELME